MEARGAIHIMVNPYDKVWFVRLPDGDKLPCRTELEARVVARCIAKAKSLDIVLWRRGRIVDVWHYSDDARAETMIPKGEVMAEQGVDDLEAGGPPTFRIKTVRDLFELLNRLTADSLEWDAPVFFNLEPDGDDCRRVSVAWHDDHSLVFEEGWV